jgi:ribosomal protein uS3
MHPCARRSSSAVRAFSLLCAPPIHLTLRIPLDHAASRPQDVLGDKGKRIRELTSVVQKRFGFADNAVELFAERVANRGLSAQAQAESLKYKLLGGLAVRRACYGIVKFVMESGAKGVEVVVAGKLRGQRAKAMKFRDGYMVKTGHSAVIYNDYATRHVMMRQGIMGVRVKIMLPHDPTGERLSAAASAIAPCHAWPPLSFPLLQVPRVSRSRSQTLWRSCSRRRISSPSRPSPSLLRSSRHSRLPSRVATLAHPTVRALLLTSSPSTRRTRPALD